MEIGILIDASYHRSSRRGGVLAAGEKPEGCLLRQIAGGWPRLGLICASARPDALANQHLPKESGYLTI